VAVNESGTVALGIPRVGAPARGFGTGFDLAPKPMKVVLNWGRKYSLWVMNFGLACCAIEFIAASMARHDFIRLGVIPFAPGPRQADLMIVSGTVSDKMAPAVKRLYEQMPEPKYVISFGACANCGGPYWDSYAVTKGIDQVIPVDVYVPGCPPRPEALLQGIVKLQEKIAAEGTGARVPRRRVTRALPAPQPVQAKATSQATSEVRASVASLPPSAAIAVPAPVIAAPVVETAVPETPVVFEAPVIEAPAAEPPTVEVPAPAPAPAPASAPVTDPPSGRPPAAEAPTIEVPQLAVGMPTTEQLPKLRVPRRHYFRELRRARDHGLSLFDKAAHDQEWEYDDES
jgi:NADH-quinone oxidoreductase subunit B